MKTRKDSARTMLIVSMCIFGTIGILRRYIPLSSGMVALVRGVIGSLFLIILLCCRRQTLDKPSLRRHFLLLIISGAAIGFNWILLFEAYNYTSVATATLCYYLAPILVILASPVVLKERVTLRRWICTLVALVGMVLVSGVTESGFSGMAELKGILFGLGAAVLYASVILMNRKMPDVPAYDKTIIQLASASVALLFYVMFTEDFSAISLSPVSALLLLVAGIVHTGIAYWLYFGSMKDLSANTVALLSYIDPVLAIILSVVFLQEAMSPASAIGAVFILGAAYISEK